MRLICSRVPHFLIVTLSMVQTEILFNSTTDQHVSFEMPPPFPSPVVLSYAQPCQLIITLEELHAQQSKVLQPQLL